MAQVSLLDHMEDRLLELSGIPSRVISQNKLEFLLDDEYIVPEGIFIYRQEMYDYTKAVNKIYDIFNEELASIIRKRDFDFLKLPSQMIDLVIHSYENSHMHLLGRFDLSGGINGIPIKLLEYNADMPTLLPESMTIQSGFNPILGGKPYSELEKRLGVGFGWLPKSESGEPSMMLGSTLGHQEDKANLDILLDIANKEGIDTYYADLPEVEFAQNEGVFLETTGGDYLQFQYFLKLIPWEFICFEEPDLLADLHNLILRDLITVINPAYTLVFQSKALLVRLSNNYPSDFLLKTSFSEKDLKYKQYVKKADFGRLGQSISIHAPGGRIIEETEGDLDMSNCIYQEFAELYKDADGEYYQPGLYTVAGRAAGLSFRRAEKMIVDNDCQFIPHMIKG